VKAKTKKSYVMRFLDRKALTFENKLNNIFGAYTILFVWIALISSFYDYLYAPLQISPFQHPIGILFLQMCIFAPICEELVFRHFPIQLMKSLGKKELMLPTILFTSVIFGWCHLKLTPIAPALQGVMGLILSVLYIKNNYSYWSAVTLHFMWNFTCLMIILSN
jgi:membrane protease YdiL (CAAX protease family)